MEEYLPLVADGAAPDGQTRLPWGDETTMVEVEAHPPVAVEAHPPEPVTHFATPEATFFTAEPAPQPPEATAPPDRVTVDDDPAGIDQPSDTFEEPVGDEEPPPDVWSEDAVDDIWADDDVWAEQAVVEEPEPVVVEERDATRSAAVEPGPEEQPLDAAAAGDELVATLDELLPSPDDLPVLEGAVPVPPVSPWAPDVEATPRAETEPPATEPQSAPPVAADAPRMVSPSHPEWVQQERVVIDDAVPDLEWLDPDATDFAPSDAETSDPEAPAAAAAEPPVQTSPEPPAAAPVAAAAVIGEGAAGERTEWFNPPDPTREPEDRADAPAAEWLTLPELDEQLAAVSESPPSPDDLPPMAPVEPMTPLRPADAPVAFAPSPIDEPVPRPSEVPASAPVAFETPTVPSAPPLLATGPLEEPVAVPVALGSSRARSVRRIAMVAAALVMGTVVVRQVNHGTLSDTSPMFVGVTSGQASLTTHAPAGQPATPGSGNKGAQQLAAGAHAGTTVAGGSNATTASTAAGSASAAGATATTPAGAATKTTSPSGTPTTAAAAAPPPASASTPGYPAAHAACSHFNNAYAARDNGGMTDDKADDVFVSTASEVYGANKANPAKWGTLYNHALTLQHQLEGAVNATDSQIEDQIALVYIDCKAAA
jgi:hypothetical protein